MPFCRKCGRRLPEYSESCPDCGTSTTAPLIKLKNKTSTSRIVKAVPPTKVAKAVVPVKPTIIVKPVTPANSVVPAKVVPKHRELIGKLAKAQTAHVIKKAAATETERVTVAPKPVVPAKIYPPHEIIKSNVSLKEDIISNPQDYERQLFDFDLQCSHKHFWPAGEPLPVSNGVAYCLKCGERLRKPKPKKRHRYNRVNTF
jgi:uncharacterized membrane protein YvbJ